MKVRGLSPKLPLTYDEGEGYLMNKKFAEVILQNLKMLLLTSPGERIMEPDFGVGLKRYLFEQNVGAVHGEIHAKIKSQVGIYIPSLQILKIDFFDSDDMPELGDNYLHITISFYIKPLDHTSQLDLLFDSDKGLFIDGIVQEGK